MQEQRFTIGKFISGMILLSLFGGFLLSYYPESQTPFLIGFVLYIFGGFALWLFQTIKYWKLKK